MIIAKVGQVWRHKYHEGVRIKIVSIDYKVETITIEYLIKSRHPQLTIYMDVFYDFFQFESEDDK